MGIVEIAGTELRGLSFSIADLIQVGGWAEASGLHMAVRLDHGAEIEEYEEVLAFHTQKGRPCTWIMWRDAEAVFVQPLPGRTQRYESVAEAIDAQMPQRPIVITDVMAPNWPDQPAPDRQRRNSDFSD